MKKHVFGRQLQRDTNERKALFKSLMSSLIVNESIKTTEAKAKAVKSEVEKIVTKAKKEGEKAERILQSYFSTSVVRKLISEVAPRFSARPGGYTRIIKIGNRLRDNAKMVILEWVDKKPEVVKGEVINADNSSQQSVESNLSIKNPDAKEKDKTKKKKDLKETEKPEKKTSKKEAKKE